MVDEVISYKALRGMDEAAVRARLHAEPHRAAALVRAAALSGYRGAQVVWGQMLLDGHGVAPDAAAALRWFRIAATAGSLDGLNMVGRCHELGWGVAPDPVEAARHYRAAADQGHAWAQFNLASLLLHRPDFATDPGPALALFVRSARAGNAKAMAMVGRFLEHGWGRPARPQAARRWYRRAAEGGDYRGQFDLARTLWEEGRAQEAIVWFSRAVEAGVPDFCRLAAEGLAAAGHPALDALAARALARLAEAEAAAREKTRAQAELQAREAAARRRGRGLLRWPRLRA